MLAPRDRVLLETASILHNVGLSIDKANHHSVGRDIVMSDTLRGYTKVERAMLACAVLFHRKAVQPALEPIFATLTGEQQRRTLILSALLRIADGLDYSQTQSTQTESIAVDEATRDVLIQATGPHSRTDAERAQRKADLWRTLFSDVKAHGRLSTPGVRPGMRLAEAAQRIVHFHFDSVPRWIWKLDERILALPSQEFKAIRLSIRCMRQAFLLYKDLLKKKATRDVISGLKPLSELLGVAREYDMLGDTLADYRQTASDAGDPAFDQLAQTWKSRRDAARQAVVTYGQSEAHALWLKAVEHFVSRDDLDGFARKRAVGQTSRVRHVYKSIMWQHISVIRAFDTLPETPDPEQVHEIRKAVKRLRYFVESMRGVLSDKAVERWRERCMSVQRDYGAVNDAHMSAIETRAFMQSLERPHPVLIAYARHHEAFVTEQLPLWRSQLEPVLGKSADDGGGE